MYLVPALRPRVCRDPPLVRRRFLVVALWLLAASAVPAPQAPALNPVTEKPALGEPRSEYVIGSGDVLQVFVWKEPDLSRDVTVRLDGKITVPLAGELLAAGRTPSQLATDLEGVLARFLTSPRVTLGVSVPNSARFYVIGHVVRSGEFPLTGPITVLQGLALAGGFREFAKTESIVIIRREEGNQRFLPVDYKRLEGGRDPSQNLVLSPGDTILVP
jgi:polysaccharide export outer membrane protein